MPIDGGGDGSTRTAECNRARVYILKSADEVTAICDHHLDDDASINIEYDYDCDFLLPKKEEEKEEEGG